MNQPHLRFDWVVSAGNVITASTLLVTAVIAYANLRRDVMDQDRRLAGVEAQATDVRARLAEQDVLEAQTRGQIDRLEELMGEVRDALRQINERDHP